MLISVISQAIYAYTIIMDATCFSVPVENFKDLELYLHMFPPRIPHPTLAVIGCVTTLGGQPPVFELQTRLAARVFNDKVQLPDQKSMLVDVQKRKDHLFKTFGKHRLFVSIVNALYNFEAICVHFTLNMLN